MLRTSVIVCTYNGDLYLEEQLNSLIIQESSPDEIIIVDDCSTDHSWDLICCFKKLNPEFNIRTFRNEENLGYIKNFSLAADLATHELVFFCDQDDVWSSDKIYKVVQKFSKDSKLTCLHTNAYVVGESLEDLGKDLFAMLKISRHELKLMDAGRYFEVLLRRNVVTGATMVIRRDILSRVLPIPTGWIHDEWIPMVSCLVGRVSYEKTCLISYRIHRNNTIGLNGGGRKLNFFTRRQLIREFYSFKASKLIGLQQRNIASDAERNYLDAFISHLHFRVLVSELPYRKKVIPIFNKALDGSYSRFSRGWLSALRDFLFL